ncbi:MAG: imidazole glycerol phosphate synthase subunit HisH [Acidobacteriota bacterium]|nr:imidazole glycerol phosphate synthase subunit HisH [Acidobacteriota bacterium]
MSLIGIVQPDSGNITSVCDALERLGRNFKLLRTPQLEGIDQLLLPGQGRFGAVMSYLRENGWVEPLREWIAADKPILCICVGMQVLFEGSDEDPHEPGLGIFQGRVTRLDSPKHPMIGWSRVHWSKEGFREGAAYFVNSYGVSDHPETIATTTYGATYCVAVQRGNTAAFQFHPEKSGVWGKELMDQCLIS